MADLRIDLAAEFKGKKAFTQATKATSSLDKSVAKLGKQIASVFAVTKIVQFGKASLKAFVEDEAAANRLATSVKNLGLAFAQPEIDRYISKLESSASIADDQLRPAFQALLTTTGSLTKSQELLGVAIEGSRGSGIDLATVAQDLASAYVGNTKGLKKYNLGLTQAQLKTVSFTQVQQKFQQQFSGANQAYLATYAGKLDVLTVSAGNAQETIGKGLVDALVLAGGKEGDVQNVADAMQSLAEYAADATRGVGVLIGKLTDLDKEKAGGLLSKLFSANFKYSPIGQLAQLGNEAQARPTAGRRFMGGAQANLYDSSAAAEKKFRDQQAKLAKEQIKAQKALTAEQKKQAALKKAGTIFDLEQIQVVAALKGKLSEEDRKRLELQFALLLGNEDEARRLTYELAKAQGLGEQIARDLASLPAAKNPFASWEAYLDRIAEKARQIASLTVNAPLGTAAAAAAGGSVSTNVTTNVPVSGFTPPPSGTYGTPTGAVQGPQVIELKITGDGDLTNTIAKNLMQQSLSSGNQTYVNRRTGGFE